MDQGYALGWDDELQYQNRSFVVLPEGVYDFEVIDFERQRHPGSEKLPACNKAVLHIRLTAPTGESTTVFHNLFLHTKTAGFLSEFFVSIGHMKKGETIRMNWNAVVGARGRCRVGIRKWVGDDGQERQSNEIKEFLEPTAAALASKQGSYTPGVF